MFSFELAITVGFVNFLCLVFVAGYMGTLKFVYSLTPASNVYIIGFACQKTLGERRL